MLQTFYHSTLRAFSSSRSARNQRGMFMFSMRPSNAVRPLFLTGMLCLFGLTLWPHAASAVPTPSSTRGKTRLFSSKKRTRLFRTKRNKKVIRVAQSRKGKILGDRRGCRVKWNLRIRPDFDKATLFAVVKWIAKQTCQNFIISDQLKRNQLHIITESQVTVRSVYRAFFSALEANNMTAQRVGRFWKIIRAHRARQRAIPTYTNGRLRHPRRDEMVTFLYQVKHLDIYRVSGLLRQLCSPSGGIVTHKSSNKILIVDYASNLYRVLKIIKTLDIPQAATKEELHILQVNHAKAQEVAQKIRQLFEVGRRRKARIVRRVRRRRTKKRAKLRKTTSSKSTDDGGDAYRINKLVPDERTNQIIVLANRRAVERVRKLIKDLDIALPGDGQIRVHYLKYASAEELAQVLSQITQGTKQKRRVRRRRRTSTPKKAAELFEGEVKVTADKATNSLVIVASRRDYESMLRVIRQLDISRKQVFIEIVILELNLTRQRELGLTFHAGTNLTDEQNPSLGIAGTRLSGLNSLVLDPTALTGLAFGLQGKAIPGVSDLLGSALGSIPSFGVMLRALQSNTDVDIISTPHILTTTNKEATLQVGQNVPFIAGTTFTGTSLPGVPNIQNIQRQDVALTLKIKPQVDAGDYVRLDFQQELTELAGQDPELGPTTTKRQIKTVILARDKQTVVIGGLVRDKVTNGASKVPLLGDLPLIGALFRVKNKIKEKHSMLVFLTPHIINHTNDFRKIFEQKMKERQQFVEIFYGKREIKVPDNFNYDRTRGLVDLMRQKLKTSGKEVGVMKRKNLSIEKKRRPLPFSPKEKPKVRRPMPRKIPVPSVKPASR
ncbi:MAG TPA: type II secretion system protein GspD [Myxococcales bacterium]|nr:type II secretion system protein GspD [Deltaproteobacteria bacterium]HAA57061.1 type II secretion system protein GspD [Myxococcales bacterium]